MTIDGVRYSFYRADNFGPLNWGFLVFQMLDPMPSGSLEFKPLFNYLQSRGHITGSEYLASIELGSEAVQGTGDVKINAFKTVVY